MLRRRSAKPARSPAASDPGAARQAAIALLAGRDFGSAELRARLCSRGFAEASALAAVSALVSEGLLSDERYAQNYVAYHAGRGQGPLRIGAQLRQLGIVAVLVDAALAGGPDWRALAGEVRRARFGPVRPVSWLERARQTRFLQYRGFSADHIRAATGADPEAD